MDAPSCQGTELEDARRKHGLPPAGTWFWTQAPALEHARQADGLGSVTVAWDKDSNKGSKMYGVYASAEELYANMLHLPAGERYAYEVIDEGSSCRNYADIEWVGDHDITHSRVRALVAVLREHCEAEYGRAVRLYVGCSSRWVDEKANRCKNSYHIVFGDLVFENNHRGGMAAFWTAVRDSLSGDEWHWDNEGKKTHIIDSAVYTRNRCMRLMLCSKRGGVPFRRISGDPLDEDDALASTFDEHDPEAWRPFFACAPDEPADHVIRADAPSGSAKRPGAPAGHGRAAKRPKAAGGGVTDSISTSHSSEELEEKRNKLVELAACLAAMHPGRGGGYQEWMAVLFAVKNELRAVSDPRLRSITHALLDDFSSIRAGYQSAGDVAEKYAKIQPRDDSQPCTTIGTLIHYARESPALVLASQASADARVSLTAAFDAIHDHGEREKRAAAREEAHRHLLGLLFKHADSAATSWRWMAQCCACLAPRSDRDFILRFQRLFIEKYHAAGVEIAPGELESAFRAPTSRVYGKALIKYVRNEVMELAGCECEGASSLWDSLPINNQQSTDTVSLSLWDSLPINCRSIINSLQTP